MNLYGFANGDPVNFSDPFGLCIGWTGIVCRVGAAVARNWRAIAGAVGLARVASRSATAAQLADDVVEATQRFAGNAGARVMQVGRAIGDLGVGQERAVQAIEQAVDKFADRGPTVAINGVQYLTSARGNVAEGVNALAVAANGAVTKAIVRLGEAGWELVQNLGKVPVAQ